MKISDQIRSAGETPKEQLQDYSNEYLGQEKDPEEVLPVDEATEAEDAEETPPSDMEAITQGKTVVDNGFLTEAEKELLTKCGWEVRQAGDPTKTTAIFLQPDTEDGRTDVKVKLPPGANTNINLKKIKAKILRGTDLMISFG
jgi:hypothetical protein